MNTTQDPTLPTLAPSSMPEEEALLVVLHHSDLSLVGQVCRLSRGPLLIGREEPRFLAPWLSLEPRTLADPCISRQQLRATWLPEERGLLVEALPGARRPLRRFDSTGEPIDEGEFLPSGGAVAIGDRLLLGFVVRPGINLDLAGGLLGESEPFAELCQQIAVAAQSEDPVLIRAEPDSGAEVVARAVHQASSRRGASLRVVRASDFDERGLLAEIQEGREISLLIEGTERLTLTAQSRLFQRLSELLSSLRAGLLKGSLRLSLVQRPGLPVGLACPLAVVEVPSLSERRLDVPLLFVQALRRRLLFQEQSAGMRGWLMAALWRAADTQESPLPLDFFVKMLRHSWPGQLLELESLAASLVQGSLQARSVVLPALLPQAPRSPPPEKREEGSPQELLPGVTRQQHRVLLALREGNTSKDIAQMLDCSPRTVEAHIAQLMRKSGTRNRTQLVAWAFRNQQGEER